MKYLGVGLVMTLLTLPAAAAAGPRLPDHAAATVAAAQASAKGAATDIAAKKARGQTEDKTTSLARAAEVSRSWKFTGAEHPGKGNGRALGAGHSDAVHEALAAGVSPAALEGHGKAVSAAAAELHAAFAAMKAKPEHPSGQGRSVRGSGDED